MSTVPSMSTGPSESWHDGEPAESEDSLEVVFSRFSLDSDRRTRRHGRTTRRRTDGATTSHGSQTLDAQWPPADTDVSWTGADLPVDPDSLLQPHGPMQTYGSAQSHGPMQNSPPPIRRSEPDDGPASSIRPYSWTGGRTRSNYQLELETLVSVSEMCQHHRLERLEQQSIAELCRHPRSVAEIGALLGVPLGVAKVLLGDMADLGLITVHHTVTKSGSTSHLQLMERVLSGLRRL